VFDRVVVFARDLTPSTPALMAALHASACEVLGAHSDTELLTLMDRSAPDCVVLSFENDSAIDRLLLAEEVRRIDRACPLIMLTRDISIEFAIRALRIGVSDLLDAESTQEAIVSRLESAAARLMGSSSGGRHMVGDERIVGHGKGIRDVRDQIGKVAVTDANVLITGESGTGKELVAQLIHQNSPRRAKPLVSINCAAIPEALLESELFGYERGAFTGAQISREGKLQHASGGTLFLDEIGDMSVPSQAKILRAIETREIQRLGSNVSTPIRVRLIAATNQDLEQLISEKKFRQDLYFRINVVRIHLPALRERREDIPELAEQILHDLGSGGRSPVRRLQGDVLRRLQMHDWPGNIRELRNVLESILVLSSARSISIADVPLETRKRLRASAPYGQHERATIISALSSTDWNRGKAAKILRCSRMTLYRKMVKHSIR
jgi:DNA-binding NtrC family response regulator